MKNLIFLACALCAVTANPIPAAEQNKDLELVQIPLAGNKVSYTLLNIISSKYFLSS